MIDIIEGWIKPLLIVMSLVFAGFAVAGYDPLENLLWSILLFIWSKD